MQIVVLWCDDGLAFVSSVSFHHEMHVYLIHGKIVPKILHKNMDVFH